MKKKTAVWLLILIIGLNIWSFAIKEQSNIEEFDEKDSLIYKTLYEELSKDYDRLATTIYWAIGSVFTLSLVIVGGNTLYSSKIYQSDLELLSIKLKEQMNTEANILESRLMKLIENQIDIEKRNIENRFSFIESSLELNGKKMIQDINAINDKNEAEISKLKNRVDENKNELQSKLSDQKSDFYNDLNKVKYDILELEIEYWELKDVKTVVLTSLIDSLEFAIKHEITQCVELNFGKLIKLLDVLESLSRFDMSRIVKFTNIIPENYSQYKLRIEERVKDIKIS